MRVSAEKLARWKTWLREWEHDPAHSGGTFRYCEAVPALIAEVERLQSPPSDDASDHDWRWALSRELDHLNAALGEWRHQGQPAPAAVERVVAEAERLAGENELLLALLREVEWRGQAVGPGGWCVPCCPKCDGLKPDDPDAERFASEHAWVIGHVPDCGLATALGDAI